MAKRGFNIIDMMGFRVGRLTVVARVKNKQDGSAAWLCKCDCGNPKEVVLSGNNLRNARTKSCGCLAEEHRQWIIDNQATLLADYRNRPTPMATCHPDLPQEARGLCGPCYNKLKQTFNPERDKATAKARLSKPENAFTNNNSGRWRILLKHLYNKTPEEYLEMLNEQGGVCAACKKPETATYRKTELVKRLQVDHDSECCQGKRSCGKCVRGLLCGNCNMLIGLAKHNPELLMILAEYVAAGGYRKMKALEQEVERCIGGC